MIFVLLWLSSLSMIICRSVHVAVKGIISFFMVEYIPLYIYHIFFIHSSLDGHFGCFHVLAIVNSAAVNIGVHMSFRIMVFSGYMLRSGIAGSYGSSVLIFFKEPPYCSPLIPTKCLWSCPFYSLNT